MRIPKQHAHVAMSADKRDFGNGQSALEEATDSFMSQIVKVKIDNASAFDEAFPRELHCFVAQRQQSTIIAARQTLNDSERSAAPPAASRCKAQGG